MNYQIITDKEQLLSFIDWLPDLEENEKFYCCLFARKKYCQDQLKSNDKAQLKRFLSDKNKLYEKIKQLEVEVGAYQLKNGPAPQESLALYINPNPRNLKKATYDGIIRFAELLKNENANYNPHAEILSIIQRTVGRKIYLDFDIDEKEFDLKQLAHVFNTNALEIVQTRGGFHVLATLEKIDPIYKKTFYKKMLDLGADQVGDQLLPVPGCIQGGFTPKFISL